MKKFIAGLMLALCLTGCATNTERALGAVGADVASTEWGMARGATEMNPLGLGGTIIARLALTAYAQTLPPGEGVPLLNAIEAGGWGAAVHNVLVFTGGPVAWGAGIGTVVYLWERGAHEREFWRLCDVHKKENPAIVCVYTAPKRP